MENKKLRKKAKIWLAKERDIVHYKGMRQNNQRWEQAPAKDDHALSCNTRAPLHGACNCWGESEPEKLL